MIHSRKCRKLNRIGVRATEGMAAVDLGWATREGAWAVAVAGWGSKA